MQKGESVETAYYTVGQSFLEPEHRTRHHSIPLLPLSGTFRTMLLQEEMQEHKVVTTKGDSSQMGSRVWEGLGIMRVLIAALPANAEGPACKWLDLGPEGEARHQESSSMSWGTGGVA